MISLGLGLTSTSMRRQSGAPLTEALRHFVMYGQSLSIGTTPGGGSVVSAPNPLHRMFSAGVRCHIDQLAANGNENSPINPAGLQTLVTLAEQISPQNTNGALAETMASGIGAHLTVRHLFTATGRGAYEIEKLSRDAAAILNQNHFINTHAAMLYGRLAAEAQGWDYSIPAFGWKHSEADAHAMTSRGDYKAAVVKLYGQLIEAAAAAAHYDASAAPLITDQIALRDDSQASGTGDAATGYGAMAVAMIEMHRAGQVICVGPTYDAEFLAANDPHFTSAGYRNHGERWGRVLEIVETGGTWHPCHIVGATRSGASLDLTIRVPEPPLVFDDVTFADRSLANRGFAYSGAGITSETVVDNGTSDGFAVLRLALDAASGGTLRYAYENSVYDYRNEVGGHVRDSATAVSLYDGTAQPNWLCTDEWEVA